MEYSLLIKQSLAACTSSQVMKEINEIMDNKIVSSVEEIAIEGCLERSYEMRYELVTSKTTNENRFFVVQFLHRHNKRLKQLFFRIRKEGFVPIVYNIVYDETLGKHTEQYLDVSLCRFKSPKLICISKYVQWVVEEKEGPKPLWKQYVEVQRKKGDKRTTLKLLQEGFDKYKDGYVNLAVTFNRLNACYEELIKEKEGAVLPQ